jgi:hypothetical protein
VIKKTFLAVAVGAALGSLGANATPTFTFDVNDWTTEGATDVTDFAVPDVTVTLGTEYTPNDIIVFTYSQDIDGEFISTINVDDGITNPTDNGAFTMTLGLLSTTSNTATYRVTELTSTASGAGSTISTTGASFVLTSAVGSDLTTDAAAVRAAGVLTATYSAESTTGVALDGGLANIVKTGDTSLVSFVNQYATVTTTTDFDRTIDVEPGVGIATRSVFTTGAGSDSGTISITETNAATHDALTSGLTVTLTGDFSFLVDTNTTLAGLQQSTDALFAELGGVRSQAAMAADGSTATFTWDNSDSDTSALSLGNVGIFFNNAVNSTGGAAIERGSFTVGTTVEYKPVDATYDGEGGTQTYVVASNEETEGQTDVAFGSWGLNGSEVTVYAAPIYPGITELFLWMTNDHAESAPVNIVATTSDGTEVDLGTVETLAANSITRISTQLENALVAGGITNDRVTLKVTTSAPACSVNVAASYRSTGDADRLALETSQTINGVHNTGNTGTIGATAYLCVL